jgi:hypothetical protein
MKLRTVSFLAFLLVVACGSSSPQASGAQDPADGAPPPGSGDDTTLPQPADAAPPAPAFPAPHALFPQIRSGGGKVLANPKIVPVTFPNDPLQADIEAFVAAFSKTTYWGDMTAEYAIAPVRPEAPIRATDTVAASITDTDIVTWLESRFDGTHPEFPAPDPDTMYVLFYPPGTSIHYEGLGTSCQTFHGYHANTVIGKDTEVVYAVISRCASLPEAPVSGIQYVSAVASHEVIEGLADPYVMGHPAFYIPDHDHLAWEVLLGGEIGDMCALEGNAFYTPPDFPYTVQRIWSNKLAAAGGDPCNPKIKAPYFGASFDATEAVTLLSMAGIPGPFKTKGIVVPVGQSKTIDVNLFSDGPTGEWTVIAAQPPTRISTPTLKLALDKNKGKNGDTLHLTITATAEDPTYGASPFALVSTQGGVAHYWFGVVGH